MRPRPSEEGWRELGLAELLDRCQGGQTEFKRYGRGENVRWSHEDERWEVV